jgi:hypothetical protein
MQDPVPENISGSKVESHEFVHQIQWGYVVLGFAVIVVVYAVLLQSKDGPEDEGR